MKEKCNVLNNKIETEIASPTTTNIVSTINSEKLQTDDVILKLVYYTNKGTECPCPIQSDISTSITLFIPILSALLGVIVGSTINYLHWKLTRKKDNLSKVSQSLLNLIIELEEISMNYWLTSPNRESENTVIKNEIFIKSKQLQVQKHINRLEKTKKDKSFKKLKVLSDDIFELITGEDFESNKRRASKHKVQQIASKCSEIKSILIIDYINV